VKIIKLFLLSTLVFLLSCQKPQAQERRASDFQLQGLDGQSVTLSNYKNKKSVLLLFWASWCPYCLKELKNLNNKYKKFANDDIEALAINVNEQQGAVSNFIKRNSFAFKVVLDKDAGVASSFDVLGIPTYILIDKSGTVRFHGHYLPDIKKTLTNE
jgi:peroxiredoxin